MSSLKKSFFWSAVEQVGPRAGQMVIGVTLARLLEPSAFGLVGMLALFLGVAHVFADGGLSASLIQRKNLSADDETSVFAMNIVAGVLLAGLLCLISPFVARFYKQPVLVPLLCVYSIGPLISSLCVVQLALLTRTMQFKKTAMIGTISMLTYGGSGILLAYFGCGVWSLIISDLTGNLVRVVLLWTFSSWRPKGDIRLANIRSLWGFSSFLLYCNLIGITFQNLYAVIIGKVYSASSLGFYDRANNLRMLPAGVMTGVVNRVAFPLFSRCQDDKALLLRRIRDIIRSTLMVSAASLTLLAVLADPLIPLVFSEKWQPTAPLLRILCYAGVFSPISALYLMALQAQGFPHLNARLETIKFFLGIITVLLVYPYGVAALAWSVVGLTLNAYFLNAWYNVGLLNYSWRMQAEDILPTLCLCACSGWLAWWIGEFSPHNPLMVILIRTISFGALCGTGIICFRNTFFDNVWKNLTWILAKLRQRSGVSPVVCSEP